MTVVDWFSDGSLLVAELPFACCAAEFESAAAGRPRVVTVSGADVVLVVSGTVTRPTAPALAQTVAELQASAARVRVLALGACACGGGPYWDSPMVVPATDVVNVDVFVPGCAPTPAALTAALETLR